MVTLDPTLHLDAIDQALAGLAGPGWQVRHLGDGQVTGSNLMTFVERRYVENPSALAAPSSAGWRVDVTVISDYEANVNTGLAIASDALDEVALLIDGEWTTPLLFEAARRLEPDGEASSATAGPYQASITWTYVH